jgi:excisionase family DNA binding protein
MAAWLRIDEVAAELRCSDWHVRALMAEGSLEYRRVGLRRVIVAAESLKRLLAEGRVTREAA